MNKTIKDPPASIKARLLFILASQPKEWAKLKQHCGEEIETKFLPRIIHELNERFRTDFSDEDKVFIRQLEEKLATDPSLGISIRVNTPENARLTFDQVVSNHLQDMVETNFEFYKRVTDDREFSRFFLDWLFDRFKNLQNSKTK